MKKLLIVLFCLSAIIVNGQFAVGTDATRKLKPKAIPDEVIAQLKESTTVFVYPKNDQIDDERQDKIFDAIEDGWTFTQDIEFVQYEEFKDAKYDGNYSFISLGSLIKEGGQVGYIGVYLHLMIPVKGKKKTEYLDLAKVELIPTIETIMKLMRKNWKDEKALVNFWNKEADFTHWHPVYLKNHLQFIQSKLEEGKTVSLMDKIEDREIRKIRSNTLYIPDYCLIQFDPMRGGEKKISIRELVGKYPYKYKVVSSEELSELVLNSEEPVYYLSYIRANTDKYIGVVEGTTGKIIYKAMTPMSYNIKDKDFEKMAKVAKKMK